LRRRYDPLILVSYFLLDCALCIGYSTGNQYPFFSSGILPVLALRHGHSNLSCDPNIYTNSNPNPNHTNPNRNSNTTNNHRYSMNDIIGPQCDHSFWRYCGVISGAACRQRRLAVSCSYYHRLAAHFLS